MLGLVAGQPLLLHREPHNPADGNAVRLTDLYGGPVGYVERNVAAVIAKMLDMRVMVMARVLSPCVPTGRSRKGWRQYHAARVLIWIEPPPSTAKATEAARFARALEKVFK